MSVKHLDHLNLSVRDLAATEAFYAEHLGFEAVERGVWNGQPWAILRSGDAMLCCYEVPELEIRGLRHIGLRITDRARWESHLEHSGLEVLYGGANRWPHSTSWYIHDPSGYELEIACWDDDTVRFAS